MRINKYGGLLQNSVRNKAGREATLPVTSSESLIMGATQSSSAVSSLLAGKHVPQKETYGIRFAAIAMLEP